MEFAKARTIPAAVPQSGLGTLGGCGHVKAVTAKRPGSQYHLAVLYRWRGAQISRSRQGPRSEGGGDPVAIPAAGAARIVDAVVEGARPHPV